MSNPPLLALSLDSRIFTIGYSHFLSIVKAELFQLCHEMAIESCASNLLYQSQ